MIPKLLRIIFLLAVKFKFELASAVAETVILLLLLLKVIKLPEPPDNPNVTVFPVVLAAVKAPTLVVPAFNSPTVLILVVAVKVLQLIVLELPLLTLPVLSIESKPAVDKPEPCNLITLEGAVPKVILPVAVKSTQPHVPPPPEALINFPLLSTANPPAINPAAFKLMVPVVFPKVIVCPGSPAAVNSGNTVSLGNPSGNTFNFTNNANQDINLKANASGANLHLTAA